MKDLTVNFENWWKYNLFLPVRRVAAAVGLCDFEHVERFYATLKGLFRDVISEHEQEYDGETNPKVCSAVTLCLNCLSREKSYFAVVVAVLMLFAKIIVQYVVLIRGR